MPVSFMLVILFCVDRKLNDGKASNLINQLDKIQTKIDYLP